MSIIDLLNNTSQISIKCKPQTTSRPNNSRRQLSKRRTRSRHKIGAANANHWQEEDHEETRIETNTSSSCRLTTTTATTTNSTTTTTSNNTKTSSADRSWRPKMARGNQLTTDWSKISISLLAIILMASGQLKSCQAYHQQPLHQASDMPYQSSQRGRTSSMANRQPNYRTTTACDGNQMELSCEDGKLIHLVRANYGRFSLTICNEFGYSNYSIQCASFRSFLYMETKCNNLTTCNVTVSKDLFGDPCEGTAKYLEVQYQCNDVNSQSNNNRQLPGSANTVISTNSSARQVTAAPSNNHKSHSSANHNNVVGGGSNNNNQPLPSPPPLPAASPVKPFDESSGNNDYPGSVADPNNGQSGGSGNTGGNFMGPDNLEHQQQQPALHQQHPVIQQPQQTQQQYCSPQTSSRNLFWNYTRAGQVARQPCPEGSSGRSVTWLCDYERLRFVPTLSPDFSQCRSNWLTRLSKQLYQMLEMTSARPPQFSPPPGARQQDEQMIKSILGELSLLTKTNELFSDDLNQIDTMISQIIAQMRGATNGFASGQFPQTTQQQFPVSIYGELFAQLTSICSSLFDPFQRNAWLELPTAETRRHLELRLVGYLKEAGSMFAQSLTAGQLADMQPIRQPNVVAAISVIINNQLRPSTTTLAASSFEKSSSNELNPAGRLFDDNNNGALLSSEEIGNAKLSLPPQLIFKLATVGIIKFLTLDVKMPNYPAIVAQLEQQQQQIAFMQEQQQQGVGTRVSSSLDSSQNMATAAAGDQNQFQKRIFGVFAIHGETGESFYFAPARYQQDPAMSNRQHDSIKQRLDDLLAQWPISVEFKTSLSSSGHASPTGGSGAIISAQQSMRQCHSLSGDNLSLADDSTPNRCRVSKYNATNFVCSCDRFGLIALAPPMFATTNGFTTIPNDPFQWGAPSGIPDNNTPFIGIGDSRPIYDPSPYGDNKPQQQQQPQQSLGTVTYGFVIIGVVILILLFAGLIINVILRITGHSRLSKKHQSFFESMSSGGPTTGPLVNDHNLMGSNPLVSAAATTQSGSIINLTTGAAANGVGSGGGGVGPMGQLYTGSPGVINGSNYKTHQLYSAHMGAHSPPMIEAYASSAPITRRWPTRLVDWLVKRPSNWLSNLKASNSSNNAHANKTEQMIHHRIVGSNTSTIGTLAYHKSQYQNGYTTSPGIHNPIQQQQQQQQQQHHHHHHQTLARAYMGSTGNGSQSGVPLNPSSTSSYASSSASQNCRHGGLRFCVDRHHITHATWQE